MGGTASYDIQDGILDPVSPDLEQEYWFKRRTWYINEAGLFICHGNICRSTMAEFVMKDLVKKAGLESLFHIESAATSTEEIGNPVYPSARRKLAEHGIDCAGKTARQLRYEDYSQYAVKVGMGTGRVLYGEKEK